MPSALRQILFWLLGEVCLLAVLILGCEGLARILILTNAVPRGELTLPGPLVIQPHPYLGFSLREGAVRGVGTGLEQRINRQGFRGKPIGVKKGGSLRVLCLGDSVTYGDSLPEDRTLPALLESELQKRRPNRAIEVVNGGVLQYTSAESVAAFALRGLDLKPDIVVFHEGANDVAPRFVGPFRMDYSHYRPVWVRDTNDALDRPLELSQAYLVGRWLASIYPAAQRLDAYTVRPIPKSSQEEKDRCFEASLSDAVPRNEAFGVALARAAGAKSLVVAPGFHPERATGVAFLPRNSKPIRDRQAQIAAAPDAGFLDLSTGLDGNAHFRDAVHLTSEGARVAAVKIADEFERRGWLGP